MKKKFPDKKGINTGKPISKSNPIDNTNNLISKFEAKNTLQKDFNFPYNESGKNLPKSNIINNPNQNLNSNNDLNGKISGNPEDLSSNIMESELIEVGSLIMPNLGNLPNQVPVQIIHDNNSQKLNDKSTNENIESWNPGSNELLNHDTQDVQNQELRTDPLQSIMPDQETELVTSEDDFDMGDIFTSEDHTMHKDDNIKRSEETKKINKENNFSSVYESEILDDSEYKNIQATNIQSNNEFKKQVNLEVKKDPRNEYSPYEPKKIEDYYKNINPEYDESNFKEEKKNTFVQIQELIGILQTQIKPKICKEYLFLFQKNHKTYPSGKIEELNKYKIKQKISQFLRYEMSDETEFYLLISYISIFMSIKFEEFNTSSMRNTFENVLKTIQVKLLEGVINTLFDGSCMTGILSEIFETRIGILTDEKFQSIFNYHFNNIKYRDLSESTNKIYHCFGEVASKMAVNYRILLITSHQKSRKISCLSNLKESSFIDLIVDLHDKVIYQLFKVPETSENKPSNSPNMHKETVYQEHLSYIEKLVQSFYSIHSMNGITNHFNNPLSKNGIENVLNELESILKSNPNINEIKELKDCFSLYKEDIRKMIKKFNSKMILPILCSECKQSNPHINLPCEKNITQLCSFCRKIFLTNFRDKLYQKNNCLNCTISSLEDRFLHEITLKNVNKIFCILCNEPLLSARTGVSQVPFLCCLETSDHFYHKSCLLKESKHQMEQFIISESFFYCYYCKIRIEIKAMKPCTSIPI